MPVILAHRSHKQANLGLSQPSQISKFPANETPYQKTRWMVAEEWTSVEVDFRPEHANSKHSHSHPDTHSLSTHTLTP